MKTTEQMREEFSKFCKPMYGKQISAVGEIEVADWWLSRFEAYKEELRAEVEKMTQKIPVYTDEELALIHEIGIPEDEQEWQFYQRRGYNFAVDDLLTLLSTPVPEGEVNTKDHANH